MTKIQRIVRSPKNHLPSAQAIVSSILPNESVFIRGPVGLLRYLEDLMLQTYRQGAIPLLEAKSYYYYEKILSDPSIKVSSYLRPHATLREFYKQTDVFIDVFPLKDQMTLIAKEKKHKALCQFLDLSEFLKDKKYIQIASQEYIYGNNIRDLKEITNPDVNEQRIMKCAEVFIDCINLQAKEFLAIKGGLFCQRLVEEIALEGLRKGIQSFVNPTSDEYIIKFLSDMMITPETISQKAKHITTLMKGVDGRILIHNVRDPNYYSTVIRRLQSLNLRKAPCDVLEKKSAAIVKGRSDWLNYIRKYKKNIFALYPTRERAKYYQVPYNRLEASIIDGIIAHKNMKYFIIQLNSYFEDANKVYVTGPGGTDFWVDISERRPILEYGQVGDKSGDLYKNLPSGELAIPPIETKGEGVLCCPEMLDPFTNQTIKNLKIHFKDGKIDFSRLKSSLLKRSFKKFERMDKAEGYYPLRSTHIAELGIGCNQNISISIGEFMDEKRFGSVHLGFGNNKIIGGMSDSHAHLDFVTDNQCNLTIEYKNGETSKILQNGKFLGKYK